MATPAEVGQKLEAIQTAVGELTSAITAKGTELKNEIAALKKRLEEGGTITAAELDPLDTKAGEIAKEVEAETTEVQAETP